MKSSVLHIRLSGLDRDNIRKVAAYIRKLNREIGITSQVTSADAIGWALQRCVLLLSAPDVSATAAHDVAPGAPAAKRGRGA